MDFQAIFDNYKRTITEHYFDTTGRVGRGQFWWFVLANVVAGILVSIVGGILHLPLDHLYNLAVLLPAACIGVRRLHDTGRSGKLVLAFFIIMGVVQVVLMFTFLTAALGASYLAFFYGGIGGILGLITLVLTVILIWYCIQPGDPGPNAYGLVPPVFDPNIRPAV